MIAWLKRMVQDAPPEARLLDSDQRVVCLDCKSDRPMASVVQLRSYALRDGVVVSAITGERVCCQDCAHTFSIGPHGLFRQHPQALPYTPPGPSMGAPEAAHSPNDEQAPQRARVLPIPLKRPDV